MGAAVGARRWEYLGRRVCGIALAIRAPVGQSPCCLSCHPSPVTPPLPACQHLLCCKLLNHHMMECFDPSPGSTPARCLKFRASGKNICVLLVALCRKHAEKGSTAVSSVLKVKRLQSSYTCTYFGAQLSQDIRGRLVVSSLECVHSSLPPLRDN